MVFNNENCRRRSLGMARAVKVPYRSGEENSRGMRNQKVEPSPNWHSTPREPPSSSANFLESGKPKPVPLTLRSTGDPPD